MNTKRFRFPKDIILLSVRWYLRYGLSYRDLEEMLEERGVFLDHTTIFRWVIRFTPFLPRSADNFSNEEKACGRQVAYG